MSTIRPQIQIIHKQTKNYYPTSASDTQKTHARRLHIYHDMPISRTPRNKIQ